MADPKTDTAFDLDDVSVVIVSVIGCEALQRIVSAFTNSGECIVSSRASGTVPHRRMAGVLSSQKRLVALVEDTVAVDENWAREAASLLSMPGIVGCAGPVLIDPKLSPRSKALALADFGRFAPKMIEGLAFGERMSGAAVRVADLPGCNMAFRRADLVAALDAVDGFVDNQVFAKLRASGGFLILSPNLTVTYSENDASAASLANRLEHGRIYSSRRLEGASLFARAVGALRSLALPIVLTGRSARHGAGMRVLYWAFLQNLAWSLGEFIGSFSARRHHLTHWS